MLINNKHTPIKYHYDITFLFSFLLVVNTVSLNLYSYLISISLFFIYLICKFKEKYDDTMMYIIGTLLFSAIYLSYFSCFFTIEDNIKNSSKLLNSKIEILSKNDYTISKNKELVANKKVIKKFNLNNTDDYNLLFTIITTKPILIVHKAEYYVHFYGKNQIIIELKEF